MKLVVLVVPPVCKHVEYTTRPVISTLHVRTTLLFMSTMPYIITSSVFALHLQSYFTGACVRYESLTSDSKWLAGNSAGISKGM